MIATTVGGKAAKSKYKNKVFIYRKISHGDPLNYYYFLNSKDCI